jgi:hypothetical protein
MTVKRNNPAYEYAKKLVKDGKTVIDDRDAWSEHRPSAYEENAFIEAHGWSEYSKWFLGVDDTQDKDNKGRYKFPFGDFKKVHRCGVLSAESRAGQYKYHDIQSALAHLHGMLDSSQ